MTGRETLDFARMSKSDGRLVEMVLYDRPTDPILGFVVDADDPIFGLGFQFLKLRPRGGLIRVELLNVMRICSASLTPSGSWTRLECREVAYMVIFHFRAEIARRSVRVRDLLAVCMKLVRIAFARASSLEAKRD